MSKTYLDQLISREMQNLQKTISEKKMHFRQKIEEAKPYFTREYLISEIERIREGNINWRYVAKGGAYALGGAAAAAVGAVAALSHSTGNLVAEINGLYAEARLVIDVIQPMLKAEAFNEPIQAYFSEARQACDAIKGQIGDAARFFENQVECVRGVYFRALYEAVMSHPEKIMELAQKAVNENVSQFMWQMPFIAGAGGLGGSGVYIAGTELFKKVKTYISARHNNAPF